MPNAALRDSVTGLLARLGYRGIADLDLRLDDRDGQYKLLDFNPRLGAQFRLFTGPDGLDVVRAAYLDLTGQPVTGAEPESGRSFMVESYDPLTAISYWRRGEISLRSWLAADPTSRRDGLVRPRRPAPVRAHVRPHGLADADQAARCGCQGAAQLTRPAGRDPDGPAGTALRRGRQ